MLKNRPPHQASAGAWGTPNRLGRRAWSSTAGCTALARTTSGARPTPRAVSGNRPATRATGSPASPTPSSDRERQAPEGLPARGGRQAQRTPEHDRLRHELDGDGGDGQRQDEGGERDLPSSPQGGPAQKPGHEGRERERLQEDVQVEAGEREAAEGVDRAGLEGTRARRSQLARQPVGGERGEGQVQRQQPRDEDGARPQRVQQVRGVQGRQLEGALEDQGVPRGRSGPRASPARRRAAGAGRSP